MQKTAKQELMPKTRAHQSVVEHYIYGTVGKSAASHLTPSKVNTEVRHGLPMRELDKLQAVLDVPRTKLSGLIGISKATLHRRGADQRLKPDESDRVVRYARLMGRAVEVLESVESARQWLNSPQVGLGGEAPLDYAQTEFGAREVEDLLNRIDWGVY